jgi:uncharacterized OB-fold protein
MEIRGDDVSLIGGVCRACGAHSFPRAQVCTECLEEQIEAVHLPSSGKLYSYSVIHQAPKGWRTPFTLGYVDLVDGTRILAHITGPVERLKIDGEMRLSAAIVADRDGSEVQSYVFTPIDGERP